MTATMDVQRNTSDAFVQLLSQWECILRGVVALGMQRAMDIRHIFICGLYGSTMFEICVLLEYYASYGGNSLPTFQDNSSVSS